MRERQQRIESVLLDAFDRHGTFPARLHEAMRYAVLDGGKRVRPQLAYAAGEMVGASIAAVDRAAAAVELIHAYSLVHDDLPCMDNDDLRRGKPTCHKAFGDDTALLVGDALQSMAFELLTDVEQVSAAMRLEMIRTLAQAAGSTGMAGGQAIDLASTGKALTQDELTQMHGMKTGAVIRAAVRMGALCGSHDATTVAGLDRFSALAGLLFQVVDDVLDDSADARMFGKTPGKDAQQGKVTFVSLMGAADARHYALALERDAIATLASWGKEADRLRQLCHFIAHRTY